jgi:predicted ATPase
MELILGNLNACMQRNQELLLRSKTVQMKIAPLVIDVELRMAGNEMTETIVAAKRALGELGVVMPRRVTVLGLLLKLRKVRHLLRGKSDDDILGLPLMRDRTRSTAVKLLTHLSLFCLLQDKDILAVYSSDVQSELIMKKDGGLSPYSANCFTIYGISEVGLGNIHRGVDFGELAMKLTDRIPCKEAECPTLTLNLNGLLHWKTHLRSMEPVLAKALNSGFEVGDVVYGSLSIVTCCAHRYMLGENLASLEQFMKASYSRLCDLGQDAMIRWTQPSMQYILNMRTSPVSFVDLTILSGEAMDESEYMHEAMSTNHKTLLLIAWTYKSLLGFNFGNFEVAATMYENMSRVIWIYRDSFGAPSHHFYGAIIFYERFRTTRRVKHLGTATKAHQELETVRKSGQSECGSLFSVSPRRGTCSNGRMMSQLLLLSTPKQSMP